MDNCGSTTIELFKIKYIQNASYSEYPAISYFLKTHFFDAFSCPQSEYEGSNFLLLCFLATGNQKHGINAFGDPRTLNIAELTQAKNYSLEINMQTAWTCFNTFSLSLVRFLEGQQPLQTTKII